MNFVVTLLRILVAAALRFSAVKVSATLCAESSSRSRLGSTACLCVEEAQPARSFCH